MAGNCLSFFRTFTPKERIMKFLLSPLLPLLFLFLPCLSTAVEARDTAEPDSTGLPGDHFSLEGALELFKTSSSPEDFEKRLNMEDGHVNNLDLNEDGEVDYIRVVGHMEGDLQVLVLQVDVSASESQDIAVIEMERKGDDDVVLQIIGDEDVYGESVIMEPYEQYTVEPDAPRQTEPSRVVVNVWTWPAVRYMYAPGYTVWVSPWRWRAYPTWWRPWRPLRWTAWHVRVTPFRAHRYHVVTTHRVVRAHKVYAPRRTHSKVVKSKTTTVVKTRKGTVKKTTTTTKVKGPRGNTKVKQKTRVSGKKRGG